MRYSFLFILMIGLISISAQENNMFININGTSELMLDADQINITAQIRNVDNSIEESKTNNDNYVNELLKVLNEIGINSDDIEISPITFGKDYGYKDNERKLNGFYTEVEISFLLKELSKYYDLMNGLSTSDYTEIIKSSYSISDYETQNKLAYEKALRAAKEKAEYMTKVLEVDLGNILEIEENNYWQNYSLASNTIVAENSQRSDVSGKVTIRRSVRVKFAIQ